MNIKRSIVLRVRIAFILVAIFAGLIFYRITHLQFVEGEKWAAKSENQNFQFRQVSATRGNVYAADGSLLATSLPFYRVVLDPLIVKEDAFRAGIDSLSYLLSGYYKDKSAASYKRIIKDARVNGKRYVILNRKQIGYQDMQKMAKWPIFRKGRASGGVIFEKVEKRYRPFNNLAGRTVGFLNEDKLGVGIEYSFNEYLEGRNGNALFQRIAGGTWKPVFDATDIKPDDGLDIQTTLDVNIQDVAETALLRQLVNKDAEFGCVVVMEVATGHIKGIINLERSKSGNGYNESYNYAVGEQGLTEPGSTFKLLSMLALLEEGKVGLKDSIDTGNGTYRFYDRNMNDAKNGGFGKITVREVFEKSSNVGISRLVDQHFGHQPSKFLSYVEKAGLNKPIDFQLIGEGTPYFKKPGGKYWYGTTLPWMSIGYEVKMTPLQTLMLYNAVANDGVMVKPMIVKAVAKGNQITKKFQTEIVRKSIASEKTIQQLQSLLEGVVTHGTAKNVLNDNYKIAGKTGTAQKLVNGRYVQRYYTSFAGYFPADNPKYSAIVVIDSPKGFNVYGGDVSAPVFKEIADRIYAQDLGLNTRISPKNQLAQANTGLPYIQAGKVDELQLICNQLGISNHYKGEEGESWVKSAVNNKSIEWKTNRVDSPMVPDVNGMSLRDALYVLENKGLRVVYQGKGRVKGQSMNPGSAIEQNSVIRLILS
ncbi:cell division protein [Rhodonellum psychrophilum GCM71 = DSM 17998]|uniref:Cell division protein n=2 Tax=Rhodonellum TaxID=336827 RepID=U5C372_9BACT|nr:MULTISPECIES: penicillin-binding protein [Rhodonellum]ERM82652.1 cell division protein [Rhodonellum psychrophilum GCM71 = DSM 17998]SDZ45373.1 cell division protein FtsI (penicillin-binding protein 3) [Rhodonellum ikkaensis]